MSGRWKKWVLLALLAMAGMGAAVAWWRLRPAPVPPGFALANGRIEATQIDIATKLPARIKDVLVQEGDFVERGQLVARMDTQALAAELAPRNVLVNAVAPSIIDTPANRDAMPGATHAKWPTPDEIASTILFLASPANRVSSGAIVPVYGRA